jgi:hypothetical protein
MLAGHVLDHVFVHHQIVGHAGQRGETHVDFRLTRGRNLMVVSLDRYAESFHRSLGSSASILIATSEPVETGLRGWACRTRSAPGQSPGADAVSSAEGNTSRTHHRKVRMTRRGRRTWHVQTLLAREPGDLAIDRSAIAAGPHREGEEP